MNNKKDTSDMVASNDINNTVDQNMLERKDELIDQTEKNVVQIKIHHPSTIEHIHPNETIHLEEKICRYCLENENDELMTPCKCTGNSKYVHRACLDAWRVSASGSPEKAYTCEICKTRYRFLVTHQSYYTIKSKAIAKAMMLFTLLYMLFLIVNLFLILSLGGFTEYWDVDHVMEYTLNASSRITYALYGLIIYNFILSILYFVIYTPPLTIWLLFKIVKFCCLVQPSIHLLFLSFLYDELKRDYTEYVMDHTKKSLKILNYDSVSDPSLDLALFFQ
ncbi:MAG: hypothetical protein Sylvanvirus38_5 [Sylvanvirus sp.]|uniref:RING-CH-type domain-containing protein n=1 Tax=Sylvanvirus sp. TaxID=2487774 RepID=A0A3G5AJ78_9VIRU|nr:MAG: hypothetical protein Sylvanvirus38_5 [Sylvanvirus sp.]